MSKEQSRELRNSLGEFATGVTVITCSGANHQAIGVTANSFNTVSLDPPLVLWSIASKSGSLKAFQEHGHFAVNILAADQQDLAMNFARTSVDRFAQVPFERGIANLPLIHACLAQLECKVVQSQTLGDHVLFVGEVLAFRRSTILPTAEPLVFSRGQFVEIAAQALAPIAPASVTTTHSATFYKDYLPYLLARAANDSAGHFHGRLKNFGLTMLSWRVLASLADGLAWTVNDLCKVSLAKQPTVSKLLDRLETQRLIKRNSDASDARKVMVTLTKLGANKINPVIAEAQGYGESLGHRFNRNELDKLKATLRKIIDAP
jgi:flavin reductase (DIM6/NTAB) family NADH-FMN oxidoreductase RutF/DNA-binding MarR family transcriptional regulator